MRCRSVNRKFVDKLQQRIEMLEARSQTAGGGQAEALDDDGFNPSEYVSMLSYNSSYVFFERLHSCSDS